MTQKPFTFNPATQGVASESLQIDGGYVQAAGMAGGSQQAPMVSGGGSASITKADGTVAPIEPAEAYAPMQTPAFNAQERTYFAEAEHWNEVELLGLCLGVPRYADRDDIAPEHSREGMKKAIRDALGDGSLPGDRNPDARPGEAVYGGVWRIQPLDAIEWAFRCEYPLPGWLTGSKETELHARHEARKAAAGRLTIDEAAQDLAKGTGQDAVSWLELIVGTIQTSQKLREDPKSKLTGANLVALNPRDPTDARPYNMPAAPHWKHGVRTKHEQVDRAAVNRWLDAHPEWLVSYRFEIRDAPADVPGTTPASKPISRQRHQEQEILRVLRELGHDPCKLPKRVNGKRWVAADVRDKLTGPGWTKSIHTKAWQRLLDDGSIREA
ncbi:MAG: hypothetical protein EPN70_00675 [Paraburkholderia sp.]|uniref:hypothetical protein n=1 Tax=Paraburkholderia sp. TaxID=1926495 RepID=UPI00120E5690|nr:hypothetical protein [Paraburkholderia sp.]TAM08288.1 MAG: hypothetical protein EPN70_00675 [Paraburkholderia sp.]TAM28058.1 MAG: hypothetical protein EPN59_17970 [Paraburkholderia sp.]